MDIPICGIIFSNASDSNSRPLKKCLKKGYNPSIHEETIPFFLYN